MSVDDSLQKMLERLGRAVSRAMAESDAAADVVDRVRREGLSLYLVLEPTQNEDGGRGVQLMSGAQGRAASEGPAGPERLAERASDESGRHDRPRRRARTPGRAGYRLNQRDVDLLKSMGIDPSRTGRNKR